MKETTVKFKCDQCEKTEVIIKEHENYPYDKGWCYLYELNSQLQGKTKEVKTVRAIAKDKHFCCLKCELEFINKLLADPVKFISEQTKAGAKK